jgi:hypothetical protein
MINTDEDITFVENIKSDLYGIKILKGKYEGVVFCYGEVKIKEDSANDQCKLTFNYQIQKSPKGFKEDQKFENYLGDLLTKLISENK